MSEVYTDRYNAFRKVLRVVRKSADLTQLELSKKLNRPQSYVSKYEGGDRRVDMIETYEICMACNLSLSAFSRMLEKELLADKLD